MSSRTFRRVLAGLLMTASLSLGAPVSLEGAGVSTAAGEPSFWALAWQWLTERIVEEPEAPESRTDAGWIIDPDG